MKIGMMMVASAAALCVGLSSASATVLWSADFESEGANGWDVLSAYSAVRVASGTDGVTSAGGNWHGQVPTGGNGAFTRWGGYDTATLNYQTTVDVYLDVNGGYDNGTKADYSSAVNGSDGAHQRDFIFHLGFYDDATTGPSAGVDRFLISASNNAPGNPADPNQNPIAITSTGWYTFQHTFYDDGGVLAVDMKVLDSGGSILGSWTSTNPADVISEIGGNRYGWIFNNGFDNGLNIDNSALIQINVIPLPPSVLMAGLGLAAVAVRRRRWKAESR